MAPFFLHRSCDPFDGEFARCVLGAYVVYSVNISSAEDVAAALSFAERKHNRILMRNTVDHYHGK